ncbi:MAG TPA: SCO family protein [Anaeromyxobacteraceae bacterium]|nr:SCO family protein [Anaeromyxobacteraceae bacterium]
MRRIGSALAMISALLAAGPARAAPPGSPWGRGYFPNPEVVTQDGKKVHFYDDLVEDRLVVVTFIYTHCNKQCPLITSSMARVQRQLGERMGKDVTFVSVSLDPERDTPERLKEYAQAYKAGPGWTFVTGAKADIQAIRRKFGDLQDVENHTANAIVGNDRTGQWFATGAVDNPKYLAIVVGDWLDPSWRDRPAGRSYAEAKRPVPPTRAETIWNGKCAACHDEGGDAVGPPLRGVVARRGADWVERWVLAPERLVAARDPAAIDLVDRYKGILMPNMDLSEDDARAMVAWLAQARAEIGGPAPAGERVTVLER